MWILAAVLVAFVAADQPLCYVPPPTTTTATHQPLNEAAAPRNATLDESYVCQMCLRQVELTKKYLECGPVVVKYRIIHDICMSYIAGSFMDQECRALETVMFYDVRFWGNRDPKVMCAKLIRNPCS